MVYIPTVYRKYQYLIGNGTVVPGTRYHYTGTLYT